MRKKIYVFIICLLSFLAAFGVSAFAESDESSATYLNDYEKEIFDSNTVESINNEFQKNGFATKKKYKAQEKTALFGVVDSISTNGKEIQLYSESQLSFICTATTKDVKALLAELESGDSILVIGKVKNITDSEFKLDIEKLYFVSGSESGKVMLSGEYFPAENVKEYELSGCKFETAFVSDVSPENVAFDDENVGLKFNISENEYVSVYCLDYQQMYEDSGYGKVLGFVPINEKRTVEDYINGQIIQKRMTVISSTKKVNDVEYDYYTETRSSASNEHAEVYYKVVDSDKVYAIAYEYEGKPQYVQFAAFILSTFSVS